MPRLLAQLPVSQTHRGILEGRRHDDVERVIRSKLGDDVLVARARLLVGAELIGRVPIIEEKAPLGGEQDFWKVPRGSDVLSALE